LGGGTPAKGQLELDPLDVRLALPVDALLEPEADELVLRGLFPHELGGLGIEVVELPLDDRDQCAGNVLLALRVLERADPPLAGLVLLTHLELVLGGDLLGHRPALNRRRFHATGYYTNPDRL